LCTSKAPSANSHFRGRPEVGLDKHVTDIVNALTYDDLRGGRLVGHGSSGAVITGVAKRAPERIANVVYLDAFVPEDGQSVLDLLPPASPRLRLTGQT
jgi:pimeloyl-ACP methyl ester carboxylesterase